MQAYLNDKILKSKIITQLQAHYDADEIIQGTYWENGKGCAVGCVLHDPRGGHYKFESELGIPRIIARLMDRIFEGLKNSDAKSFPLAVMKSINVGADLKNVWPQFAVWLLIDESDGVIQYVESEEIKNPIKSIADLYQRKLRNEVISIAEWANSTAAAYATATAAATADAAAYAAAAATAAAAAYKKHWRKMADKLCELLKVTNE